MVLFFSCTHPSTPIPIADFSFTGYNSTYTFHNQSKYATAYLWDFGDGTTSTDENPKHKLYYDIDNTITLTATNSVGVTKKVKVIKKNFGAGLIITVRPWGRGNGGLVGANVSMALNADSLKNGKFWETKKSAQDSTGNNATATFTNLVASKEYWFRASYKDGTTFLKTKSDTFFSSASYPPYTKVDIIVH